MSDGSKLLIEEPPLQVLPTLAKLLGIEQAIILQQVQYWVKASKHDIGGHYWVYNTYKEWAEQFPWLSERAVRHHVRLLEGAGLLISGDFNKDPRDHTKWYRIGYDALGALLRVVESGLTNPSGHATNLDTPPDESCHMQVTNLDTSHHRVLPETTTREDSDDRPEEFDAYEKNIGMLTPVIADKLKEAVGHYPDGWIVEAIGIAAENNARSWRYIEKVLDNWEAHGKGDRKVQDGQKRPGQSLDPDGFTHDPDKYGKGRYGHMVKR